jgi:hypothetical protein
MKGMTLLFGPDDAARVWLNGREVWAVNRIRGATPDDDVTCGLTLSGLTLKEGGNLLVVKVGAGNRRLGSGGAVRETGRRPAGAWWSIDRLS